MSISAHNFPLEDRNVAVDLGPVSLGHTLGDPDDVANFLLLQLDVGVEHPKLELVHECVLHQLHLWRDMRSISKNIGEWAGGKKLDGVGAVRCLTE